MLTNILLVGIGSMVGGISRYLLSGYIHRIFSTDFPLGTFLVNVTGCFLIGIIAALFTSSNLLTNNHRILLAVGFCGSFTTFSTFSLDNLNLLTTGAYRLLVLNVAGSLIAGIFATWLGFLVVRNVSFKLF